MRAAALLFSALASCQAPRPKMPSATPATRIVKVWGSSEVGGNAAVMRGCAYWWPFVECIPVLMPSEAEVKFFSLPLPDDIVGLAFPGGIVLIDPEIRPVLMTECIAHELGHELGAQHVPLYGPVWEGEPYGRAVMNPYLSIGGITAMDILALQRATETMYASK